jgi:hypothetical protein
MYSFTRFLYATKETIVKSHGLYSGFTDQVGDKNMSFPQSLSGNPVSL